ncbi:hypothetical protein [Myxococcus sp. Y35]|uniref:hypothetical protein n=1 Tax=Pseudomyxococcus flavus TaxID=3115648 RepID=UPI003CE9D906
MGLFDAPDPLDELVGKLVNLTERDWRELDYIAERLAAAGVKSPLTKKEATRADVIRQFIHDGIEAFKVEHGPIPLTAPPAPAAAKKKPAAKKGGAK